jgi:hypothetical protein
MFAGYIGQGNQTGSHSAIPDIIVRQLTYKDGTGTAIPFTAPAFRPHEMSVIADIIQQRHTGRMIGMDIQFIEYK